MSKLLGGGEWKVSKLAPQRTVISWRKGRFFYFGLRVPPRCTASLWVASLGTRIQCGGTLSPLPTGRDSLGIGAEVQWNGLTVLLELLLLGGLQTHCCRQSSQEDCAAVQRHCDTNHRKGCTAYWEFGTIRCHCMYVPVRMQVSAIQ